MKDSEIIEALEECQGEPNCGNCPYGDTYNCFEYLREDALDLINRQQKLLTTISDLIVENTYPGFDKNGKPVSIWNADGYKKIENLLKGGADNA